MHIEELSFQGVLLCTPAVFRDERGFFMETFRKTLFEKAGIGCSFVQDNLSYSKYGTLRGMHFQTAPGQAKLISVPKGKIFDVFVDMRSSSSTYGQWGSCCIDDVKKQTLFLPVGFAHGFCCISEEAFVSYKVSAEYNPVTEKGFRFDDPQIGIVWPIAKPIVSARDAAAPYFSEAMAEARC